MLTSGPTELERVSFVVRGMSVDRLSGLDASFLYLETPEQLMHVCGLVLVDTDTIPGCTTAVAPVPQTESMHPRIGAASTRRSQRV